MTSSRFLMSGPTTISVSGGRTSGFLLAKILEAHGGTLPQDCHAVFANTGKERPQTLEFVREMSLRWGVPIRWVEWRTEKTDKKQWEEVDFHSASRNGEPFAALIDEKKYLPNFRTRICTQHLKIMTMHRFLKEALGFTEWTSVVGIRYDERRRWRILGIDPKTPEETKIGPLVSAKISKPEILAWWKNQEFDLKLGPNQSNCDLCFLKGKRLTLETIRENPEFADWWIAQEDRMNARFVRENRQPGGYRGMRDRVLSLPMLPGFGANSQPSDEDDDDSMIECNCTD